MRGRATCPVFTHLKVSSTFSKVVGCRDNVLTRVPQNAKHLFVRKGRRGTAGQKNSRPGSGTHTPGGVPGRSLGYISPLFHSGVFSHLSRFLCAQAARPPLSLSQRKWAKKRSRGNPLMYFWDGEYSPLRIPLPSFLGSHQPTHRLFSGRLLAANLPKKVGGDGNILP